MPRRYSKYHNIKTTIDGIKFDSKKEAARYEVLRDEQRDGLITNLRLQVPYRLKIGNDLVCTYRSDFVYERDGVEIVEDVKGKPTDVYKLKKKLMRILLGVDILET